MALEVNGARGEVGLKIGDTEIVIAATMRGLATLSTQLGCKSFDDLWSRLAGGEIATVMAAVECLAVRGDVVKAMEEINIVDLYACNQAIAKALTAHTESRTKNTEAAKEKK